MGKQPGLTQVRDVMQGREQESCVLFLHPQVDMNSDRLACWVLKKSCRLLADWQNAV
ncbi:hypothetical protein [Izhakiella capsodis]|nr:hypothetical protein [Izhakiella capsodis]